jgi:hypothetical protein
MMANDASNLFQPDSVLPDQFFSEFSGAAGCESERRLMLAVLQDAVECFQKYALARDSRGNFEFDEACRWIESDEREWPYSFENICDVLGLNPVCIREGLSRFGRSRIRRERRTPRIVPVVHASGAEFAEDRDAEFLQQAS